MSHKRQVVGSAVYLGCLMFTMLVNAAEFEDSDIIPAIASVVFSQHAIGLIVEPRGTSNTTTGYFVATREDFKFQRVSEQEYSQLLAADHFHRQIGNYHQSGVYVGYWDQLRKRGISVSGPCGRKEITGPDFQTSISLRCTSSVTDILIVNDKIWVGTAEFGDHGEYGAEELIVASLAGDEIARIDTGGYLHYGLAGDPWAQDVWVLSQDRITIIDQDHTVKRKYWPIYKFDDVSERPDVFVIDSDNPMKTDPLAIIAYSLGESHFQNFYNAVKDLSAPLNQHILYSFRMNGPDWSSNPILPEELTVLLEDAEPNGAWRRFVCLLDDERAKELCLLDFNDWPDLIH